jgi:hypothetical protein
MMLMGKSGEIPWRRLSMEAAAIVASILLAFAIDAWWQEHVEDQREREVLIALLSDFENSKAEINDWRNFHLAVQKSDTKLLRAITSDEVLLTNDEIGRLLSDLSWWDPKSHFTTGALNSLIYGGELSVIQDDALRRLLADWPVQIETVALQQRQDYDFFLNVWMPFLRTNSNLLQMAAAGTTMPGRPVDITAAIDLHLEGTWSHSDMVANKEFHNILVQKSWIQFDILRAFDEADVLLDETILLIESRL